MRHRIEIPFVVLALLVSGCTKHQTPAQPKTLFDYLLTQSEAPKGTVLDAGDSGPQTLEEYTKDDQIKRRDMAAAGFVTSYFKLFISPDAISSQELKPGSVLAISFGLEFRDTGGAAKGLAALKAGVMREGSNLSVLPPPPLGTASFELAGTLQKEKPPGYLIAWTFDRYVLGMIAVSAPGAVSEQATRDLATLMAAHESP